MHLTKGFRLREVLGVNVLVAEDVSLVNFNKMVSLNESAAYLWKALEDKEFTVEDMAALLEEKYEVSHEKALEDSEALAKKWLENSLVQE
ncbi:MAG: PqqD family protein [Candidatus Cryptobacteroides sp.]